MKKISIVRDYYNGVYDVGSIRCDKSVITVDGMNSQIETIREYFSENEEWETITIKNKLADFFDRLDGNQEWLEADVEDFLQIFETVEEEYKPEFGDVDGPAGDVMSYIEIDGKQFSYNNRECDDENFQTILGIIYGFNPISRLSTKMMKDLAK